MPTPFERMKDGTNYSWSIRAIRERWGLSTAGLGEELGVAKRTIQGWEAGRMPGRMALEQLRKLATRVSALDAGPKAVEPLPATTDPGLAEYLQRITNNEQPGN